MNLAVLLDMAATGYDDRVAVGDLADGISYSQLRERAQAAAAWLRDTGTRNAVLIDVNSPAVPILLFAAAYAETPFAPLNFRLADAALTKILQRTAPSVAVVEPAVVDRLPSTPEVELVLRDAFLERSTRPQDGDVPPADNSEAPAVLLFTSGTTGTPKAAILRHRHLFAYVTETVEFMSAGEDEAVLVSVPAYHIAGIATVLSSVYAGRRIVYLPQFDAEEWVATARRERVTHAMVVPTMLERILEVLEQQDEHLPALRHLSYGGGKAAVVVVERALDWLPHVDFVNAYGLTETSSTISVLTPEDHRVAARSSDPSVRRRLASVGRPSGSIELEIRDPVGSRVGPSVKGEIWVRGSQVAGEYQGTGQALVDGWFPTRDGGYLDDAGYLHLEGRLDDVIVRGGENISPREIEEVLVAHAEIQQAAAVGIPDIEWGEAIGVVVVTSSTTLSADEVQAWVVDHLRSSRRPSHVMFADHLPFSETGKLLRRQLRSDLATAFGTDRAAR